jgi:hypothetical protein
MHTKNTRAKRKIRKKSNRMTKRRVHTGGTVHYNRHRTDNRWVGDRSNTYNSDEAKVLNLLRVVPTHTNTDGFAPALVDFWNQPRQRIRGFTQSLYYYLTQTNSRIIKIIIISLHKIVKERQFKSQQYTKASKGHEYYLNAMRSVVTSANIIKTKKHNLVQKFVRISKNMVAPKIKLRKEELIRKEKERKEELRTEVDKLYDSLAEDSDHLQTDVHTIREQEDINEIFGTNSSKVLSTAEQAKMLEENEELYEDILRQHNQSLITKKNSNSS